MVLWAVPYLAMSLVTLQVGFLSNAHAAAITKALQVRQAGRLELAGLSSPPGDVVVASIYPSSIFLSIVAALVMGSVTAVVAADLARTQTSWWLRALILLGLVALPSMLFIATSSIADAISFAAFVLAWRFYVRFAREHSAYHGFGAGLLLALAFGVTVFAPFIVFPLAMAAPLFFRWGPVKGRLTLPQALTGVTVILLPTVLAVVSWIYLNWLFTGDPLRFVNDPASPLYAFGDPGLSSIVGDQAVPATVSDVLRVPMYLAVAVISMRRWGIGRTLTYLSPVVLIAVMRNLGFAYSEHFAVATLVGFAVVSLSERAVTGGVGRVLLTVVVVVQTTLALLAVPPGTTQVAGWRDAVIRGVGDPSGDLERTIGERLARAAPDSVLADDTTAYRLIARAGTVGPFVLPTSPLFDVALSNPRPVVDYILVSTQPGVGPLAAVARTVPKGFVIEAEWPGWRLLRDVEAPPLLSG